MIGLTSLLQLPSSLLYLSTHISLIFCLNCFSSLKRLLKLPFKIKLPKVADEPLRVSFTPWSKTELRAIVKELPKPREDPQKFFEEFRVILGSMTPGCQIFISLCACWQDLVKPRSGCRKQNGKAQRMIFETFNQRKLTKQQVTFYKPFLESSLLTLIGQSFKHTNKER